MRRRGSIVPLLLLLAAVAGAGGCRNESSRARPPHANEVRVLLSADPASLSLLGKMDLNGQRVAQQVTDSLVQYDAALRLQPRVAESWDVSADGKTVTFHLRPGVRWHDGTPVTADDVVFTVEKARDPAVENRTFGLPLDQIETIEAVDDATVRVQYAEPTPDFLDAWRVPLLPRHLAGVEKDLLTSEFADHPVGCGPFRFVSYRPRQEITLAANDDYWDGRPSLDGLIFAILPDQRTAYQSLLLGELDLMTISPDLWSQVRDEAAAKGLGTVAYSMLSVWPVIWNEDGSNPFFTDRRVRTAMVLALDRQTFIDTVARGQAEPGITTFLPQSGWANPDLRPRPYDPLAAARLLDEAGWTDTDGDGVRDKDGRPFRFTLLVPNSTMQLTSQIVAWEQQEWAKIGVAAEIERMEWQAFRERRGAGDFDAVSFTMSFTPPPDQFFDLYHSSAAEGGWNFYGLRNAEIDALLERGRTTFDTTERHEIYDRLQSLLYEEEPISCIFYFRSHVVYDDRLRGVTPSPLGVLLPTEGPRLWGWSDGAPRED